MNEAVKEDTSAIRECAAAIKVNTEYILARVNSIRRNGQSGKNKKVEDWIEDIAVLSTYAETTYQGTVVDPADTVAMAAVPGDLPRVPENEVAVSGPSRLEEREPLQRVENSDITARHESTQPALSSRRPPAAPVEPKYAGRERHPNHQPPENGRRRHARSAGAPPKKRPGKERATLQSPSPSSTSPPVEGKTRRHRSNSQKRSQPARPQFPWMSSDTDGWAEGSRSHEPQAIYNFQLDKWEAPEFCAAIRRFRFTSHCPGLSDVEKGACQLALFRSFPSFWPPTPVLSLRIRSLLSSHQPPLTRFEVISGEPILCVPSSNAGSPELLLQHVEWTDQYGSHARGLVSITFLDAASQRAFSSCLMGTDHSVHETKMEFALARFSILEKIAEPLRWRGPPSRVPSTRRVANERLMRRTWSRVTIVRQRLDTTVDSLDADHKYRLMVESEDGVVFRSDYYSAIEGVTMIRLGCVTEDKYLLRTTRPSHSWRNSNQVFITAEVGDCATSREATSINDASAVREYRFDTLRDLHLFQGALTGYTVVFDGWPSRVIFEKPLLRSPIGISKSAGKSRVQLVKKRLKTFLVIFFCPELDSRCRRPIWFRADGGLDWKQPSGRLGSFSAVDPRCTLPDRPGLLHSLGLSPADFVDLDLEGQVLQGSTGRISFFWGEQPGKITFPAVAAPIQAMINRAFRNRYCGVSALPAGFGFLFCRILKLRKGFTWSGKSTVSCRGGSEPCINTAEV